MFLFRPLAFLYARWVGIHQNSRAYTLRVSSGHAIASEDVIDTLVNDFSGKLVFFSTKEDTTDENEEGTIANKKPKSAISCVLTGPFSAFFSTKKVY